ncbi:MAG: WecB/TagA/CpsF family glycosyltransferase [Clostridiales bacterium]|nr:WecB/TagA/CpsF family glycosyltransferase [Clostridiales bacterium]
MLGAKIDDADMAGALLRLRPFIGRGEARQAVTLNAEMLFRAQKNPELLRVINEADLVTADGAGVVWAARVLGVPLKERVAGVDLMTELCRRAAASGWKIFLLGGAPGVAELAARNLRQLFAGIDVGGTYHGFFAGEEGGEEKLLARIEAVCPQILFVGMGSPRQEYWISQNRKRLACDIALGVGGSLDVIAGKVKRAPVFWQKMRLEWLWRAILEPKRIPRLLFLPLFVLKILRAKKQQARRDSGRE